MTVKELREKLNGVAEDLEVQMDAEGSGIVVEVSVAIWDDFGMADHGKPYLRLRDEEAIDMELFENDREEWWRRHPDAKREPEDMPTGG